MGSKSSKDTGDDPISSDDLGFNDFHVLRSIGKGSFGKVCIVRRKKTESEVYAMKYMNKLSCWKQGVVDNVVRELQILSMVRHSLIVNLWFTFQDEEDIFMVSDLMLGGDLRYHINKQAKFSLQDILVYACEIGSVLDYLHSKRIVHRDIKPDNILLDEKGHLHLTDFNIATIISEHHLVSRRFAGTIPYAAPEVFKAGVGEGDGYSYSADWWSLGVTLYETIRCKRPFPIQGDTSYEDALDILHEGLVSFPSDWPDAFKSLFLNFFKLEPEKRVGSLESLLSQEFCSKVRPEDIMSINLPPQFIPSQTHLNYDPTYELEEMIIESKPLHKKKQRLTKRQKQKRKRLNSTKSMESSEDAVDLVDPEEKALRKITEMFVPFNRLRLEKDAEESGETAAVTEQGHGSVEKSSSVSSPEASESACAEEVHVAAPD